MFIEFEIIKIFKHHSRGLFIISRLLNFKEAFEIKEGSFLNGIPIYHYLEMYPWPKADAEPRFDIYVFRSVNYTPFSEGIFHEGEKVELRLLD
jgi:hypothetical protein